VQSHNIWPLETPHPTRYFPIPAPPNALKIEKQYLPKMRKKKGKYFKHGGAHTLLLASRIVISKPCKIPDDDRLV
jgi:hypothetical protein